MKRGDTPLVTGWVLAILAVIAVALIGLLTLIGTWGPFVVIWLTKGGLS